jgi:hypothetical protein
LEWRLQINFHQQDEASVILEDNAPEQHQQVLGELTIFSCFVCRQLVNLGDDTFARGAASLLSQLSGQLTTFVGHNSPNAARLVDYKGSSGYKQFFATLRGNDKGFAFTARDKGFGWLGRGYGYFSPNAMMVLLKYLARRRIKDSVYLMKLETVATHCGYAYLSKQLGLTTSFQVAVAIALNAMQLGQEAALGS